METLIFGPILLIVFFIALPYLLGVAVAMFKRGKNKFYPFQH